MRTTHFLVLIIPLLLSPASPADEPPEKLDALTRQYELAVKRATEPLKRNYIEHLKQLKTEYTKAGRLEDALAVQSVLSTQGEIAEPERQLDEILQTRKWRYTTGRSASVIQFQKDGMASFSGATNALCKYSIRKNKVLTIHYPDGNSCDFDFGDLSKLSVTGRTKRGNQARSIAPIEP